MAGTPVNPSSPYSGQNAPVSIGIPAIAASHPGFIRESPSGELKATGSGGAILPLSNALYVDQGAANANGDGSIATPFKTLTDAVAAGNALGKTAVTIFITPYDYTSESTLITGQDINYSFVGLGGGDFQSTARIPDVTANGNCYFNNLIQGSLNGLAANGGVQIVYDMASGLGVQGLENSTVYLYVNGPSTTFDPNNFAGTLSGTVQNIFAAQLNGGSIVAPSDACSVQHMTLRNGSVVSCGTFDCVDLAVLSGSNFTVPSGTSGTGAGRMVVQDSTLGPGNYLNFLDTSSFRGAVFGGIANLGFKCSMDSDSYFSLFAAGGNTDSEIVSLTAGEPSCRVPHGDDNNFVAMSGQGKVVIPAGVLTANRSVALASSDSINQQLIIFDSFAKEGFTFEIRDGASGLPLYTFDNALNSLAIWRATFIVISAAGNSFGLFSVEPIFWVHP